MHSNLKSEDVLSKQDIEDQDNPLKAQEELSPALKKAQESYEEMKQAKLETKRKYALLPPEKQAEENIRTRIVLKRMNDIPLTAEEKKWLQQKQSNG